MTLTMLKSFMALTLLKKALWCWHCYESFMTLTLLRKPYGTDTAKKLYGSHTAKKLYSTDTAKKAL